MDGIHFVPQPLHLLQHALPRSVTPLLGLGEHGFGIGEVMD
ncbi:hypothetical protein [Streptomyces sichuanensis]|nr:hypothetical protein [Streptomyces sichuanensis]